MLTPLPPPVFDTGIETSVALPPEVERLAHGLARVHGRVVCRREKNGLQLYITCPECLAREGRKALQERKLAVNADRRFGTGKYATQVGQYNADYAGYCMRESRGFNLSDLLAMPPLKERGFPEVASAVTKPAAGRCLIPDGQGHLIPDHPGEVVSLLDLPAEHPAVRYLTDRRFDLRQLHRQFRVSFCTREAPENPAMDRYYRKLPCGFRDTPQNRIIFYADVQGVQRGWQARIIDCTVDGLRYYLHPYTNQWVAMDRASSPMGKDPLPHVLAEAVAWNPSKYKTAFSSERNLMLMGFDAAVAWNQQRQLPKRVGLVAEGPLDAGRVGPPGVPLLGKYVSPDQAQLLRGVFDVIVFLGQHDQSSRNLDLSLQLALTGKCGYASLYPPTRQTPEEKQIKDFGDMTTTFTRIMVAQLLREKFQIEIQPWG